MLSDSTRATQFVRRASAASLALAAVLILALRQYGWVVMAAVVMVMALLTPVLYVLTQRFLAGVRQRETDKRIVRQTRDYLLRWQEIDAAARAESQTDTAGQRRMPSSRGFRRVEAIPAAPGTSATTVCEAATRPASVWQFSPRLPHPVTSPLGQLVPLSGTKNPRRGAPRILIN